MKPEMKLKAGDPVEFLAQPPIAAQRLRAYAEASGDSNPIHLDEAVALKAGLPGIIAHGMLSAGFIAERAVQVQRSEPGLSGLRLKSFQSRFKAMIFLGDVISVGGTVKEASPDSLSLELQAKNQKGETTTTGIAVFGR